MEMNEPKNLNILKKLHEVMKDVGYIQKDARNEHSKYNYASERTIKEHLHAAFEEHKVLFRLSVNQADLLNEKIISLKCSYSFFDVDSGESIDGDFVGAGHCRDDKGIYAAITGAIKYILTSTFLIPTGDDPENNENNETPAPKPKREPKPKPKTEPEPAKSEKEALRKPLMNQLVKTFGPKLPATAKLKSFVPWLLVRYNLGIDDYAPLIKLLDAMGTEAAEQTAKEFND